MQRPGIRTPIAALHFWLLGWPDLRESICRFARIDSEIHANHFRVPALNPFFANRFSGHQKLRIAGLIRADSPNRSNFMNIVFFLRIESCDLRCNLRCESPGHLSKLAPFSLLHCYVFCISCKGLCLILLLISKGREWGLGSVMVVILAFLGRPNLPSRGPETI